MRLLRLRKEAADFNLKATLRGYRTNVDLSLTLPSYTETIRQFEDSQGISYYPVKQNAVSGALTLSQPLPTDGSISLTARASNTDDLYDDSRNLTVSSRIELRQPIAAIWGYNQFQINLRNAKLNYETTSKSLIRAELDLEYRVSQEFFGVIQLKERMKIAQMTFKNQQSAYNIARSKYQAGIIGEVDALQMEVDYAQAQNDLDLAHVNYADRMETLKQLLGIPMGDSIVVNDEMKLEVVDVDEEQAVELAMKNRLELRQNEISMEQQRMSIRQRKAAGMISGNIAVSYNFSGVDRSFREAESLSTTFRDSWDNMIDRKGALGASVSLSVPLLDWGANRARVRAAENQLVQQQVQDETDRISIERDIRSSVSELQRSLRSFVIMEKNIEIAEKSFAISMERYSNGDISSEDIASARVRLNSVYINRLSAYINYKLMLSDLARKTFFDFEKGISLLEPVSEKN